MASTAHDDGFHEIQLNGKQLVFLFMAGTVVAVVIFLLGVFVGRGVRAESSGGDPLVGAVTAPEIPAAAASTANTPPASTEEDLSYHDRLNKAEPAAEKLTPPPAPATTVDRPARGSAPSQAARETAISSVPTEPAGEGFAIQLAALGKREEAEAIVRRLAAKGYSAYLMPPPSGAPAVYRVRVGKFKDRREAEAVSARLQREEQFKPWIVR